MEQQPGILIIGHGSEQSSGPLISACGHAERLLESGRFSEACVAFLMAGEDPCATIEAMRARTIHIVPLFMCDGYYTRVIIPKTLGLQGSRTSRDGRLLIYGPPIGMHPGMAEILRLRTLETCREAGWDPSGTQLAVIGHGSPKSSASAEVTHRHAGEIRQKLEFNSVECAFIDEAPKIEDWLNDLPAHGPALVLAGFFAADGLHSSLDIPKWIAAWEERTGSRAGARVRYTGAVGADKRVTTLMIEAIEKELIGESDWTLSEQDIL